eukprot:365544-Chlamydomonas_euryale.AAC.9
MDLSIARLGPCRGFEEDSTVLKRPRSSQRCLSGHHVVGEEAVIAPGGFDVALLSAGGCLAALDAVMRGTVR